MHVLCHHRNIQHLTNTMLSECYNMTKYLSYINIKIINKSVSITEFGEINVKMRANE